MSSSRNVDNNTSKKKKNDEENVVILAAVHNNNEVVVDEQALQQTALENVENPNNKLSEDAESTTNGSSHYHHYLTEPEQIAQKIEQMRENRIPVTMEARVRFLKDCRAMAQANKSAVARISIDDLKNYRERVLLECQQGKGWDNIGVLKSVGWLCDVDCLLTILDRALEVIEEEEGQLWFYYRHFNWDHLHTVRRFPILRNELTMACLIVFLYYLFTPILFCNMMQESNICGGLDGDTYRGWVSALYFASTTMSTVGYGDLSVAQDPAWKSLVGSLYMLLSMIVAVVAFSAAAQVTLDPFEKVFDRIFERFTGRSEDEQLLHERIRRVSLTKITELSAEILTFIAIGVFAARWAAHYEDDEERRWSWMTSFYWAVQTTTTIGYGDLAQPFGLRYFKIVYLMLSTVLVGRALGRLGSLRDELAEVRREHAWSRRKVTNRLIDEMQAYVHDDKVDAFEFLVSSLVTLGKISSDDISPIMAKFKTLAGSKGYISMADTAVEEKLATNPDEIYEDAVMAFEADD